jgi:hypothetical protein
MTCQCGHADECDGETAIYYPLQDGGMCSVQNCTDPNRKLPVERQTYEDDVKGLK